AQITGQLEHPGIVPVHDLGFDENGHPFYVMKFVRGRTLKTAINEFHGSAAEPGSGGGDRGGREVGRVRLLQVFLDLCHAVAYARSAEVDERTDVYLLGATLYEILTGQPPRSGTSRDEILELARTASVVPPRKIAPDTPRALQAICLKAMCGARERRYESPMA